MFTQLNELNGGSDGQNRPAAVSRVKIGLEIMRWENNANFTLAYIQGEVHHDKISKSCKVKLES